METEEKLVTLKRLQELDRELLNMKNMKAFEPRRLAEAERKAAETAASLSQLDHEHTDVQHKISRLELDIKSREEKIQTHKVQMLSASTNREYQAFLKELSLEEMEKSRVEENLLELMIEIDSFTNREKETRTLIREVKTEVERVRFEVKAALDEIASKESKVTKSRNEVAALLDPETVRAYEGLFDSRNGEAVVAATYTPGSGRQEGQYICNGCYLPLTHQMVNLLLIGRDMVRCKSCGRILYIEANTYGDS